MNPEKILEQIKALEAQAMSDLELVIGGTKPLEEWKNTYLGRKSELPNILRQVKDLDPASKRQVGQMANEVKLKLEEAYLATETGTAKTGTVWIDPSYTTDSLEIGHLHPVSQVVNDIVAAFREYGFIVADGRETELERYNFDLLNIPAAHPARDEWDTFWLTNPGQLLRTHTSPVQVRHLEGHKPPVRILAPGKTYRYEAEDASHASVFHQIEGLLVDEGVNLGHFKFFIAKFIEAALGNHEFRLRPSFFPFTEPSFEVDIKWGDKWLELMGGGMVHPNVLRGVGLDPARYQGFAFGAGVERIVMSKYGIPDIRQLYGIKPQVYKQF
jgi:phenylalanyl-tRNA synthetase alpha chain